MSRKQQLFINLSSRDNCHSHRYVNYLNNFGTAGPSRYLLNILRTAMPLSHLHNQFECENLVEFSTEKKHSTAKTSGSQVSSPLQGPHRKIPSTWQRLCHGTRRSSLFPGQQPTSSGISEEAISTSTTYSGTFRTNVGPLKKGSEKLV